jgi:hypothetical protein
MNTPEVFYHLAWAHGDLSVRAVGGMLAPLNFDLGDGLKISPLHVAPWADEAQAGLSPLMAGLRGEWPCLPFGPAQAPERLPQDWQARQQGSGWDHGYCANHAWERVEQSASALLIAIDLPPNDPVARLERVIRPDPYSAAISVALTLYPRADAVIPFALHPSFVVPDEGVDILSASYSAVHAYPMQPEPGVSRVLPGSVSASLTALPTLDGASLDASHLPLPFKTEELLQLSHCQPPLVLGYRAQQVQVLLDWDSGDLPDVMLWISNGGRAHAPWSGRHYALGVEPCNSCFDLSSVALPPPEHLLAQRNGLVLKAGVALTMAYQLSARRMVA